MVRVAPQLMGQSRRGEREPGKSDQIDALAVARAVVREGVERFPAAFLDERAMEIRLLADHRKDLVAERTRIENRLRWHWSSSAPSWKPGARALARPALAGTRRPRAASAARRRARTRRAPARHPIRHSRAKPRARAELRTLVRAYRPRLLAEIGCGTLTAATLIGRTAGAERFETDARFARQAGTAPIPVSSGKRDRHRLHRGGDRQLNRALHTIAITRAQRDPETRAYLDRKIAEGKTRKEALRCLKRYLARRFHHLLSEPHAHQPTTRRSRSTRHHAMLCLT